ncbi:MAG: DUF3102 domain-containing protein [Gemmatimonadota bacterium]
MSEIGPQRSLEDLARQIRAEHEQAAAAIRRGLEHARRAGELLIEAKGRLDHGEWLPWLESRCDISVRTAQAYMRIARRWDELANTQRAAHLTVRDALRLLSAGRQDEPAGEESAERPAAEEEARAAVQQGYLAGHLLGLMAAQANGKVPPEQMLEDFIWLHRHPDLKLTPTSLTFKREVSREEFFATAERLFRLASGVRPEPPEERRRESYKERRARRESIEGWVRGLAP